MRANLEEQCEPDPLVVGDISSLLLIVMSRCDDPGVRNLSPHMQRKCPAKKIIFIVTDRKIDR